MREEEKEIIRIGGALINEQSEALQQHIKLLEQEVARIESMVDVFAAKIRIQFESEIIEEQELATLYRELQRQKKEKRRATKAKQKGFKPGLKKVTPQNNKDKVAASKSEEDLRIESKRLYREAMLKVHPDRFAKEEELEEKAAEMTRELIEIYQSKDIDRLKEYHSYIMSGEATSRIATPQQETPKVNVSYLKNRIRELEARIDELKSEQLYQVLTTYENPMSFMQEIQAFFDDRLTKLRKRTRKARKAQQ